MTTKRAIDLAKIVRGIGPAWEPNPEQPAAVKTALAVTVALLRALRDRGLLSEGEIDDLFGEAAGYLKNTSGAQNLLSRLHASVEDKDDNE
jgi:hypothetical protein